MNIGILSRSTALYSTQSLIRAAQLRNHYVRVFDHMNCDIFIDNDRPRIYYNNIEIKGIQAIIPRIGSTVTKYGAAVIRQFEAMNVFTTLDADALLKSRDKISCMQILSANGIRVPVSALSHNIENYNFLLDQVSLPPYIIKLIEGTHGMGVILSESKSNAESILEAFYSSRSKVLVQKFISEAKGSDIRIFIVDGEIVGTMKRQAAKGEFRSNLHRGGTAEKINISHEEKETALKAAEIMGLKVAGVDMLQTKDGPLVLEVNASPGLEGIESVTGNDIAGKIIKFVEKHRKW
ncbi:MAG: RimK family alpha-L-glutamate ligase [Saprospiraceae bacterium]|nr:RimK family alpha-L-glutamate ligase [Saprospiraceae bacterium]MCB9327958.1 RimK family alpha-L-glutamate ligase [Lewinellaceae bacterium]HPK09018.1 RimK family alpha-L-glutamate ligase [Saprospiraceae bacterium]